MRAESWMDYTPRNPKTPVQLAEEGILFLEREVSRLNRELITRQDELSRAHKHMRDLLAKR